MARGELMGKFVIILAIFLIFISFVNAKYISVDPCAGQVVITQDANNFYMTSKCFDATFPKIYNENDPLIFYDKYNKDAFFLKLFSLEDVNVALLTQSKTTSFEDIGLVASIENGKIVYKSADNKIRLLYSIDKNKLKAGLEIEDWQSKYQIGKLQLRTMIHKEADANSHFINTPAIVDGNQQDIDVAYEQNGVNQFIVQTLFVGNSFNYLEQDPIYQADYTPTPAEYLIDGLVKTYPETSFASKVDITAQMSDNNTGTYVLISRYDTLANTTLQFDDNGFESTQYLAGTNQFLSVDFTITDYDLITRMWLCGRAGEEDALGEDIRMATGITWRNQVSFPETTTPTGFTCFQFDKTWITAGVNRVGFGCYAGCSAPKDRFFMSTDTSAPISGNSWYYNGGAWVQQLTYEHGIRLIIERGVETSGNALSGHWIETYDPQYDWFLRFYKTDVTANNMTVLAYLNNNSLSTQNVSEIVSGVGYFNINVSSLMDYQFNTLALNYTQLRLVTEDSDNIAELYLRAEANDSSPPTISNCQVNSTLIQKGEYVRLQCNVTDNIDVGFVNFTLNTTSYQTIKNNDIYYQDIQCTGIVNGFQDWGEVYAVDILGNDVTYDPNLSFYCNYTETQVFNLSATTGVDWAYIHFDTDYQTNATIQYGNTTSLIFDVNQPSFTYSHDFNITGLDSSTFYYYNITVCESCGCCVTYGIYNFTTQTPCIWVADPITCLLNDSYIVTYSETNGCGTLDNLPIDNGTYMYCNYCSEDLQKQYVSECYLSNGTGIIDVQWHDNNYFSCCIITLLPSDCDIFYSPYNATDYESCIFQKEDFALDLDLDVFFGFGVGGLHSDKVTGKIWINDTNNTYYCVSYVHTTDGKLIQTNPSYTVRSTSTFQVVPKEYEDREFFVTQNGLANIYWTSDGLVVDGREYLFGVECSGNNQRLFSEKVVSVNYDPVNAPITRWFWFEDNMTAIILGMLLIIFIVLIIAWVYRGVWKR